MSASLVYDRFDFSLGHPATPRHATGAEFVADLLGFGCGDPCSNGDWVCADVERGAVAG
jgi:hypothetical protein